MSQRALIAPIPLSVLSPHNALLHYLAFYRLHVFDEHGPTKHYNLQEDHAFPREVVNRGLNIQFTGHR